MNKRAMRVLDIDLDFFLRGVEHYPTGGRLDPNEFPPWLEDEVFSFLKERCGLTTPLPGSAFEHHDEVFYHWGEAAESGRMCLPLEVVHLDAHADLGLGDSAYIYLMTELAFEPIENRYEILMDRRLPTRKGLHDHVNRALNDANWLMFAVACGWISDLTYVSNSSAESTDGARPGDLLRPLMKDLDINGNELQIIGTHSKPGLDFPKSIDCADPPVPFHTKTFEEYQASQPFDMVFLTRSPDYTPASADAIFDAIESEFIDSVGELRGLDR